MSAIESPGGTGLVGSPDRSVAATMRRWDSPLPGGPASPTEVRATWALMDGDVMQLAIRRRLRRSLGFCPRHTWLYAMVDVESHRASVNSAVGRQPFDSCILYAELLGEAAVQLRARAALRRYRRWTLRSPLATGGGCLLCESSGPEVRVPSSTGSITRSAAPETAALPVLVNTPLEAARWCRETVDAWESTACPQCLQEIRGASSAGPPAATIGGPSSGLLPADDARARLCRPHLLAGSPPSPDDLRRQAAHLRTLRRHVFGLLEWMTFGEGTAAPRKRAAWIETLGWFAGWRVPLVLAQWPPQ
jgi:hypothetical protein